MMLLRIDPDGSHCFVPEGVDILTEEEIEFRLMLSHNGIWWFAKALKRSRPTLKWEI